MLRNVRLVLPLLVAASTSLAAPYIPPSDEHVLERLSVRPADPRMAEVGALRRQLRQDPKNPDTAVALARRYYALVAAEGDPRYVGYAQAALGPWWSDPQPPAPVRVMRAILRQFNHEFAEAVRDLDAAAKADSSDPQAWSWLAAIHMVQADYDLARKACDGLRPTTSALIGIACTAYADSMTGRVAAAAASMREALDSHPRAPAEERLWVLTRLAEAQERRGGAVAAEAAYRAALALGLPDTYLLAAYADFLLDRGRAQEVVELLRDKTRADVLLLRLAIAEKAMRMPVAADHERELASRFEAARLRGDATHRKEESRFVLALRGDAARALVLAQENFAVQKEAADARILLEAAVAAKQPEAAKPVLAWMERWTVESVALKALAEQARAAR